MSFQDILELSRSQALLEKLSPDEVSIWKKLCRQYSKTFHTDLILVQKMDPELVCYELFASQLDDLDLEENIDNIIDMVRSIEDPEYDIKQERALREEIKKMREEDNLRIERGESIHHSLEEPGKIGIEKELPKTGGLNSNILNQLNNDGEKITGEF